MNYTQSLPHLAMEFKPMEYSQRLLFKEATSSWLQSNLWGTLRDEYSCLNRPPLAGCSQTYGVLSGMNTHV